MRAARLPLTYVECRTRFERSASVAGLRPEARTLSARGPSDEELAVQCVALGSSTPRRALVVMSGVHGVEGFIGSAAQCSFVERLVSTELPGDVAVLVIHAVNPWGMAWWRRQNEHNVDLNRNWRRSEIEPVHNDAYDELHPYACPDVDELPDASTLFETSRRYVAERGLAWVRDAITVGQYRHRDGLHFGGDRTEESTEAVESIVTEHLRGVERVLTIDLHTGHGPTGAVTFLSDQPVGSSQDDFLRTHFAGWDVEATADNPAASTAVKSGQIANGLGDVLPGAICFASSVEFGTRSDTAQLAATYREHWVHRRGDRSRAAHAAAVWDYRECFTPDDPAWEQQALDAAASLLDASVTAVTNW
jgi:hypothetical protein